MKRSQKRFLAKCGICHRIGRHTSHPGFRLILKLKVKALDAIDRTPVLDIKPHVREFGPDPARVRQPKWMTELMRDSVS